MFVYENVYGVKPETVPDLTCDNVEEMCPAMHPEGPMCTRLLGHTGRHAAGNGDFIVAVWS